MKISIDIDADQIYEDGFEGALMDAIVKRISRDAADKAEKLITEKTSALMVVAIDRAVDQKLANLMNEPIVMTDRYGAKKFLGSVEDYIKQEIDNRLLRPVDSNGKTLTGSCSNSDAKNWLEWSFNKLADDTINSILSKFKDDVANKTARIAKEEAAKIVSDQGRIAISAALSGLLSK